MPIECYPAEPTTEKAPVISRVERTIHIEVKQIDEKNRSFWAVASTDVPDRFGDVILQEGWVLDKFKKNPVIPWGHDYSKPPVARAKEIYVEGGQLIFLAEFPKPGSYDLADIVWELYRQGFLKAFSVGFIPLEWEPNEHGGITYKKQELLEISAVTVPANPEALMLAYKSILRAVPPKHTPPIDEDSAWDADEAIRQLRKWASKDGSGDKDTIDWAKYAKGFGWYDENDKENFGAYKLPHHYVKNGKLVTPWSGVRAAMAALLGARGGVKIPENERRKVYDHLAAHYKQFDKEPPEFHMVELLSEVFSDFNAEIDALHENVARLAILVPKVHELEEKVAELAAQLKTFSANEAAEELKAKIKDEIRRWIEDA